MKKKVVEPDIFKNKSVLITGGTGSFGKNFARHLLASSRLKKIIIFSRDELKQYHLAQELKDDRMRFFLGDVRDEQRLRRAFNGVDIVVHAAALKQVPTLEFNPFEAVKTNILGSQNVIEAAIDQGVEKALLISTDKAAEPINLYGSTKLCAEKLFIHGNVYSTGKTVFSCVRYGNVLGSRGSIVETLMKNPNSDQVFITDKEMTRFWLTLEDAFKLVTFALTNMVGGETFVPKVPSMRLIDLFETIASKAKMKIIGIRPGEKLHEVLITKEEARRTYDFNNYFVILPAEGGGFDVKEKYKTILKSSRRLAPEFTYTSDTNDWQLNKEEFARLVKEKVILT